MARHQQPTWLGSIDDRLNEVFEALAAAGPLESTQELCPSLLTDSTAGPHKNSDGPFECVPPRFIQYGWDIKAWQHFDFVCRPGLPAFGAHFGPTENDLRGEKGHYFAEAFETMFAFVATPPPLENLATALKESLVRYLSLRGHKLTLATGQMNVDAETHLSMRLSALQQKLLQILRDGKPKTKDALAKAWGKKGASDEALRKAVDRFNDKLLKHPEAGLRLECGKGMYRLIKK